MRTTDAQPRRDQDFGDALLQLGRPGTALTVFDRALTQDPGDTEALAGKGRSLCALGRLPEGLRHLRRAAEVAGDDAQLWREAGSAALALGDSAAAYDALTRCRELRGADVGLLLDLAVAAFFELDAAGVRDYVESALREDPGSELALAWRERLAAVGDRAALLVDVGRTHCLAGRYERGAELLEQALALPEQTTDAVTPWAARAALGAARAAQGRLEEALDLLEAVVSVADSDARASGPDDATVDEARVALAATYAAAGRAADAAALYDRLLVDDPHHLDALVGKAELLLDAAVGDGLGEALELCERAVRVAPLHGDAWLLAGQLKALEGDAVAARLRADHGVALDPRPTAWLAVGQLLWRAGEHALAARYLRVLAAGAEDEPSPAMRDALATPLLPVEEELSELESSLAGRPDCRFAPRDRATIYQLLGDRERALAYVERIWQLEPAARTIALACERGDLQLTLGRYDAASLSFADALALDPGNPVVAEGLAFARRRAAAEAGV